MAEKKDLGVLLRELRDQKNLKLRQVESATENNTYKVSNAYLSQLENGSIKNPSPKVLYALSEVYEVPYSSLLESAGYNAPNEDPTENERLKKLQLQASNLTDNEFDMVIEYIKMLKNLRSKKKK